MDTYQLAELALLVFYGLAASICVSGPLALIMPFLWKNKGSRSRRFLALIMTLIIVIVGSYPAFLIIAFIFAPAIGYISENNNGAFDGTGLAFLMFFAAASISLCCLISLWAQKLMLGSKKSEESSESKLTA